MYVNVKDCLAGALAIVDNRAVPFFGNAFAPGDLPGQAEKMTYDGLVLRFHSAERGNVLARDYQIVQGRLWIDVFKRKRRFILEYQRSRYRALYDPAKQTVGFNHFHRPE